MITIRKSTDRGHADHGWLKSYHTFSFADYYDARHESFRDLRVINEDWIAPSQGFGTHGHRDMEIITYVIEGELSHKDNMGTGSVILPGEVQQMSAGRGVLHSEFNHSDKSTCHLLQIWILPDSKGVKPSYDQKRFDEKERRNALRLVASRDARNGSIGIHQDVDLYATVADTGKELSFELRQGRAGWVQLVKGKLDVNGTVLNAGDGAAIENEQLVKLKAVNEAEFLFFDLN